MEQYSISPTDYYIYEKVTTKKPHREEVPIYFGKIIYRFKNVKNEWYLVELHHYQYEVYIIKFYLKNHRLSKEKFITLVNNGDARKVILTVVKIAFDFFKNENPFASFAFLGVPKKDEIRSRNISRGSRYRVYALMSRFFASDRNFYHIYKDDHNAYLLLNKNGINGDHEAQDKATQIMEMVYQNFDIEGYLANPSQYP